ncbi:23510_t:CDS:2 [Gigaspora rosea]|nr:23510_t:CDS:2 [Gigaspora rosea]
MKGTISVYKKLGENIIERKILIMNKEEIVDTCGRWFDKSKDSNNFVVKRKMNIINKGNGEFDETKRSRTM